MKDLKNSLIKYLCFFLILLSAQISMSAEPAPIKIDRLVTFIALGTGSMTGTYFPLGKAFANVWTTKLDNVSVISHSTRGSIDNIRLLKRQELGLAIAQSDIVMSAIKGTGSFSGEAYPELKVLMSLFPEVIQIVVPADSEIKSVEQLKGKKVIVGARGSGNSLTSLELLAACGISSEEFEPVYISFDESIQAIERREYDAAIVIAGIPTKVVSELQRRIKIRILPFSQSEISELIAALPYLSVVSIPGSTYEEQPNGVMTVALMAMLVSNSHVDDNMAYGLCQLIFHNLEYLQKIHQRARDISIDTFMNSIPDGALHSGAQRFYNDLKSAK